MDLSPAVGAPHTRDRFVICTFSEDNSSSVLCRALVCERAGPSPEPLWLLSEPWPLGALAKCDCWVMLESNVSFRGKASPAKKLHSTLPRGVWCAAALNRCTHTEMLSVSCFLSNIVFLSHCPLSLCFSLFFSLFTISFFSLCLSRSLCCCLSLPLAFPYFLIPCLFTTQPLSLFLWLSLSLPPSLFSPSLSPAHLHCDTLAASHTPGEGVQLVHYVSRVFLRVMENTQDALAFHHSTGKRETLSPHLASIRETFRTDKPL